MSFTTWDVNGYGINETDCKLTYSKIDIMNLLTKAPITAKPIMEWLNKIDNNDSENIFDEYEDEEGHSGPFAVITKAISEIENIWLEYHCAENGNFILFPPFYPWQDHSKNDSNMTPEKLDEIYLKYFGSEGDYVSAQYQG